MWILSSRGQKATEDHPLHFEHRPKPISLYENLESIQETANSSTTPKTTQTFNGWTELGGNPFPKAEKVRLTVMMKHWYDKSPLVLCHLSVCNIEAFEFMLSDEHWERHR